MALGAVASTWASQFVGVLLYGLKPHDPTTLVGVATLFAAVAAIAAGLPALRAARTNPADVFRES